MNNHLDKLLEGSFSPKSLFVAFRKGIESLGDALIISSLSVSLLILYTSGRADTCLLERFMHNQENIMQTIMQAVQQTRVYLKKYIFIYKREITTFKSRLFITSFTVVGGASGCLREILSLFNFIC